MEDLLKTGLMVAGGAQFLLCLGSVAIPRCLQWSERTAGLVPLIRQMFFTYAGYILVSHIFFAILSLFFAEELLAKTGLAKALLTFMGLWWSGRIFCQFFYFDREGIPETAFNKVAESILVLMFIGLVIVYWGALLWSL